MTPVVFADAAPSGGLAIGLLVFFLAVLILIGVGAFLLIRRMRK